MNPAAGQIWREDDNRRGRYVLLIDVGSDVAVIVTCDADGRPLSKCKHTNAKLSRFGKAKGYKFVRPIGSGEVGTLARAAPSRNRHPAPPAPSVRIPGSYVRDDGATMVEVDAHRAVNYGAAVTLGLFSRLNG